MRSLNNVPEKKGLYHLFLIRCLMLLSLIGSTYAVIDVGYKQEQPGEVRTTEDRQGNETNDIVVGGSFVVDSHYPLIINPGDVEGYGGIAHSNTKAYRIMTYLFGTMDRSSYGAIICAPPNPCSSLMGTLFSILNSGILTLGMIFLGYTITNSAFSDAAQGTALGQKFSPQEVALRSAVGIGFLLPTSTGYSVIQIAIVKLILLGSSAGTGLWQYLVDYRFAANEALGSAHLYDGQDIQALGGEKAAEDFIKNLGDIETCILYENQSITNFNNWMVSELYTDPTGNTFIRTGTPQLDNGSYSNKCGQISLGQIGNDEYQIVVQYLGQVRDVVSRLVAEYFLSKTDSIADITTYQEQFLIIKNLMRLDLEVLTLENKKQQAYDSGLQSDISQSEWLDIPGYFFNFLTTPGENLSVDFDSSMSISPQLAYEKTKLHSYYNQATEWAEEADQNDRTNMEIAFQWKGDGTGALTDTLREMFQKVKSYQDPLVGLAAYGRQWLETAMQMMIAAYVFSLVIATVTGIASDYVSSSQMGIGMALIGLISTVLQAFGAIIPIASMFAIGLPMMPLILFSSAIIAWIIYTIAAVMSGPIIAIGMISPGGGLGKAAPAMIFLINLFMRPCLHVIGLVAGAKLFNITYIYFTQAFITTVYQIFEITAIPSDGVLMSLTSIIFLYAYTFAISALCNRCYSLITAIPDKVFMWVAAPPMGLPEPVAGATRTALQRSATHAEQKASEMGRGLEEFVRQRTDEAQKAIEKREREGKPARDLGEDLKGLGAKAGDFFSRTGDALSNFDMKKAVNDLSQNAGRRAHNARNFFGGAYTPEQEKVKEAEQAVFRANLDVGLAKIGQFVAATGALFGYSDPHAQKRLDQAIAARTEAKEGRDKAKEAYKDSDHYKFRDGLNTATAETTKAQEDFDKAKRKFASETDPVDKFKAERALQNAHKNLINAQKKEYEQLEKFSQYLESNAASINKDGRVDPLLENAGKYYKRSSTLLAAAENNFKNAQQLGASQATIDEMGLVYQQIASSHEKLTQILSQHQENLSGWNQLRLGVGERFDNIWKTTFDSTLPAGQSDTEGQKYQTFAFHKDPRTAGIVSSFISRNYNRGMARFAGTLGMEQSSQGYLTRAKVAEQYFRDHYDPAQLTSAQRFFLRQAEVAFNVLGSWKYLTIGRISIKDPKQGETKVWGLGKLNEAGKYHYSMGTTVSKTDAERQSLDQIMRSDYRPTHQFKNMIAPKEPQPYPTKTNTAKLERHPQELDSAAPAGPLTKQQEAKALKDQEKIEKKNKKFEEKIKKQKETVRNIYQGPERRNLRDAREAVDNKRRELANKGVAERDIVQDPQMQALMADLKKAELALDQARSKRSVPNLRMTAGLRALDRGIKHYTKRLAEDSRLGIARAREEFGEIKVDSASNFFKKTALGAWVVGRSITHAAVALPAAVAIKVPGAFFRPNRRHHSVYSDREIFAFKQISYDKSSYNTLGISTDTGSAAQSFRDIAEVLTLGWSKSANTPQPSQSQNPLTAQLSDGPYNTMTQSATPPGAPIVAQLSESSTEFQDERPNLPLSGDTVFYVAPNGTLHSRIDDQDPISPSPIQGDLYQEGDIHASVDGGVLYLDYAGVAHASLEPLEARSEVEERAPDETFDRNKPESDINDID